jgi:hypothetical protein
MTREKKIEKISRLVPQALGGDFKALAEEIVDVLEEEEPEQFFDYEIVSDGVQFAVYEWFKQEGKENNIRRLDAEFLAATIGARIEGAKWWSIDADGLMEWWASEPAYYKQTFPVGQEGWTNGNFLAEIPTTIRQEPEKGEL